MASALYDPLSRIDLPAPRHDIESEDESEGESDSQVQQHEADAGQVIFSSQDFQGKATLVLIDQVGEGIASRLGASETATIHWQAANRSHNKQIASMGTLPNGTAVLLLSPGSYLRSDLSRLSAIVRQVLDQLQPSSIQLISHYHPSLYISNEPASDDPPLRHLSTTPTGPLKTAKLYAPPNYLSSTLDACVLQECALLSISAVAVLVPLTRPQSQSVGYVRAPRRKTKATKPALDQEFPSDDEDLQEDEQDQPDPTVSSVLGDDFDLEGTLERVDAVWKELGLVSASSLQSAPTSTAPLSGFIAIRRQEALNRGTNVGGMYM